MLFRLRNRWKVLGFLLLAFGSSQTVQVSELDSKAVITKGEEYKKRDDLTSRADLLAAYGWKTPEQQEALCQLLKYAGVELDLENLQDQQPTEELLIWLLSLINETQAKFWNRQGGKERWEISPLRWMKDHCAQVWPSLGKLGCLHAVEPEIGSCGTVCVLGASKYRMESRLRFLVNLMRQQKLCPTQLILLSGERLATRDSESKKVDGTEEELELIAKRYGRASWEKVTEMDILRFLVEKEPNFANLEIVVVDTPAHQRPDGTVQRPTTQSTIERWLDQHPLPEKVFFISNQPYVQYQSSVIGVALRGHPNGEKCEMNVIGEAFIPNATPSEENVKQGVEALGSLIRAKALLILLDKRVELTQSMVDEFRKIYNDPASLAAVESLKAKDY